MDSSQKTDIVLRLADVCLPLASFDLRVSAEFRGRCTGIFGPSGAGKTSLLDLIAGLRQPKTGRVELHGEVLTDVRTRQYVLTRRRGIGYVPQDIALFPHLSVRQNLLYGAKMQEDDGAYRQAADLLEITHLAGRDIATLSGGEMRRVAIGRALLAKPRLLLLDEPLANLEDELKGRLIPYLLRVRDEVAIPMLFVTHSVAEVNALCDDVLVLKQGAVIRQGAPATVLPTHDRPSWGYGPGNPAGPA